MKYLLLLLGFIPGFLVPELAKAQGASTPDAMLSLSECVDILAKNNLTYRDAQLQAEAADALWRQVKSQQLPSLALGASQSVNLGRSIDRFTNAYIDQLYNSNYVGAGLDLTLFRGFQIQNQVRQNQLLRESAIESRTAILNAQTILLVQAYVQVLATRALNEAALQQVEASQQQVDRVQKQVSAGVVGESGLYEIKAQLANDRFDQVTALNNYRAARLALFQLLNLPPSDNVELEPLAPADQPNGTMNAEDIYEDAQKVFPELRGAELRRQSFTYLVKSIKAGNFPSLTLSSNFGAFYASTNANLDYFQQLNATRNGGLSVGLNIPLMGRWVTRPRVATAQVQERIAQNQLDITRQQLRQAIEQAVLDANAASDRFAAAQSQLESLTMSFAMVESRLNAGTANIFEYSLAKANLARAQANAIRSRYEHQMRQRLLQFYRQGGWNGVL
ncbi:TolC family protein [Telluribacter sp. SYSU D00476]|uniref:TolC family protein n=1 Tax=Telluribacter sp. SYSU D00476 TaxID=2811430 RepID=UPI001FF54CF6|nr:TolC family protein [Telluribacter sp. SYSU D00476]